MTKDKNKMKIAVAMSGGVDSSVAAAFMVEKYGKENVFGVTAKLFCYGENPSTGALFESERGGSSLRVERQDPREKACCSLEAIEDAKRVCDKLGISHYVINEEKEFELAVIKNFISAYKHGQTPIPCIPCNTMIKFGTMLEKVKKLGADKLVTGHYARIVTSDKRQVTSGIKSKTHNLKPKTYYLKRGVDEHKDQTYFLYGLNQNQLAYIDFPVGEMKKSEVKENAKKLDIKVAEKKESQGVCFVTEGKVIDYLADKIESAPGNIIDTSGKIIGRHNGHIFYTIGQRKRIGGGHKEPMFVVSIDPLKNEVVIGDNNDLYQNELSYLAGTWILGKEPKFPLKCTAKIRYNTKDTECIIQIQNKKYKINNISNNKRLMTNDKFYKVKFREPQRAITPGQSIVLYDGDNVLGGGIISS